MLMSKTEGHMMRQMSFSSVQYDFGNDILSLLLYYPHKFFILFLLMDLIDAPGFVQNTTPIFRS